jgi:glycosyltransferase involved in cell wall biosynthesis
MSRTARERGITIFLVSPFVPVPPARGIELRIYRLLQWMKQEGYRVILVVPVESIEESSLEELQEITYAIHWTKPALRTRVGMRFPRARRIIWERLKPVVQFALRKGRPSLTQAEPEGPSAMSELASAMNSTSHLGDDQIKAWFAPDKLIRLVSKLARKYRPDAVIAEYIFSTPVFAALPAGTLKIIDTIDVFSRKEDQVLAFGIADPLACSEAEERRALLTADVIVAIQSREARLFRELVPEREVILAGMDFDVVDNSASVPTPNTIAVVASDNALNVHGLTAFLAECWPSIKVACPGVSLHIVGRVGDMCRIDDPQIRYSGWIDDLDRVYREASVVINPTVAGTGLKIKSVQALAHGKPLVAWTNGVEGLDYDGEPPFRECRSWPEFASTVTRLLHSDEERVSLERRALNYAREEFSASRVYAALGERLSSASRAVPDVTRNTGSVERGVTAVG